MRRALYGDVLRKLYATNKNVTVAYGLDNSIKLHSALGNPLDSYQVVHVAGTNGKGSVCFKVAKALEKSGFRTGLFTSPHNTCFRERATVEVLMPHIWETAASAGMHPSFFECATFLSVAHFADQRCDVVVLETGLGGRFDSTNICAPVATCITSIALDHVSVLGDTVEKIAFEKAGIIKPGVPVCVGPRCPDHILRARAAEVGAPYYQLGDPPTIPPTSASCIGTNSSTRSSSSSHSSSSSSGSSSSISDFDEENSRLATLLVELVDSTGKLSGGGGGGGGGAGGQAQITAAAVADGVALRPRFRFEQLRSPAAPAVPVVLDVAHNEAGIRALLECLRVRYSGTSTGAGTGTDMDVGGRRGFRFVVGFSADKDITACVEALLDFAGDSTGEEEEATSRVHFVQSRNPRALRLDQARALLARLQAARRGAISNRMGTVADGGGGAGADVGAGGAAGVGITREAALAVAGSAPSARAVRAEQGHFTENPSYVDARGSDGGVAGEDSAGAGATAAPEPVPTALEATVLTALEQADRDGDVLVVCGSIYIMQEVAQALGVPVPTDPVTKT